MLTPGQVGTPGISALFSHGLDPRQWWTSVDISYSWLALALSENTTQVNANGYYALLNMTKDLVYR